VAQFDHSIWDGLLKRHVLVIEGGRETRVDYDGMLMDRAVLEDYLERIASLDRREFDTWELSSQLAFLINTYNAWTVELILMEYPGIRSIRQIGFFPFSAWRRNIVNLFGNSHSLDDLEHGMIRGWGIYNEPRIHFAINCAAIGCPALRAEAYVGERLEEQLNDNTRLFLRDRSRNYYANEKLYVSRIFSWYSEDFELGWNESNSVSEFLLNYRDELEIPERMLPLFKQNGVSIRFSRYDWSLNGI
tara:strand:+ start:359 stop:1096 length:738 start_codon:yes stop_codon:yes gene_type:complete